LTTINRTYLAIQIVGRPRATASRCQLAAIGSSQQGSRNSASSAAKSSGSSRTWPASTSSHSDSTCPSDSRSIHNPLDQESDHLQAEFS
jgi:hypothetical protein